ncbi:hypothetical protein BG011_008098 [Mortierella polycephala]|uniref:Guanine nucleotide-binding protein subunit gamma n=1 Tax=Mortierella polycephala TaxID=41804 RepID=A0A9P6QDC5_9FUNG|nr:hypothetical protein BG011_008098 [Mortierella polycephala]
MSTEMRLQRQLEHNKRLREQYELERITVSQASSLLIQYCMTNRDVFVTQVWGELDKQEDPFMAQPKGCGCSLM